MYLRTLTNSRVDFFALQIDESTIGLGLLGL